MADSASRPSDGLGGGSDGGGSPRYPHAVVTYTSLGTLIKTSALHESHALILP